MSPKSPAPAADVLVAAVHRAIRVVGGDETPRTGTLVANGEGTVAIAVPLEELDDWAGWRFSGAVHVLAAVDVRLRPQGMDALLPWCRERLAVFLARRRAADRLLSAGEIVTVAVSVLRGMAELEEAAEEAEGEWWLTDEGRPVFAHEPGAAAAESSRKVLTLLAEEVRDRALVRALLDTADAVGGRIPQQELVDAEERLLLLAAPQALVLDAYAPEKAERVGERLMRPDPGGERQTAREPRGAGTFAVLREGTGRILRASREAFSARVDRLRVPGGESRKRSSAAEEAERTPRRKKMLVAAGAAGVVVLAGLLWPNGDGDGGTTGAPHVATAEPQSLDETHAFDGARESAGLAAEQPPAGAPQAEDESVRPAQDAPAGEDERADGDPLSAAAVLLDRLAQCAGAEIGGCADALAEGSAMPAGGLALRGSEQNALTLVEEYGDIAVLSLRPSEGSDPGDGAEQMLVLVMHNGNWLVRDVVDVAHQPVSGDAED